MKLFLLKEKLAICKLPVNAEIPAWIKNSSFFSITKTVNELSVVCEERCIPEDILANGAWLAYEVEGPLNFDVIGVLHSIISPLANAKISVFAISSFDTDYVLIKEEKRESSLKALKEAGFTITE